MLNQFINRSPILDQNQDVVAYEMKINHYSYTDVFPFVDYMKSCKRVLMSGSEDNEEWLLGDKPAFLSINEFTMMSNGTLVTPPEKTVLELVGKVANKDKISERADFIKSSGYKLCISHEKGKHEHSFLCEKADYVKVDVTAMCDPIERDMIKTMYPHSAVLIVENVATSEQYELCKELNISLYQGFFFANLKKKTTKTTNSSFKVLFNVINKISQDAEIAEIEREIVLDPTLGLKLLNRLNSSANGLAFEIKSIGQAINLMGRKNLYRWLTGMLVSSVSEDTPPTLMKDSIIRGRMLELVGNYMRENDDQGSDFFITGVFSLLDRIMGVPMADIVEPISIKQEIKDALIDKTGDLGMFIKMVEACEANNHEQLEEICDLLQISPDVVNDKQMEAMVWIEQLKL